MDSAHDEVALPPLSQPDALSMARACRARGWWAIPIPAKEKGPRLPRWQDARIDSSDIDIYFRSDSNIGITLGGPSGGLVDADLDATEAVKLGPLLLPPTEMTHGRPGKPESHRWYRDPEQTSTMQLEDERGEMIVELRSTGGQTVIPPSTHPSGERLAWEATGEPARVAHALLVARVRLVAVGTLLVRQVGLLEPEDRAVLMSTVMAAMVSGATGAWTMDDATRLASAVATVIGDTALLGRTASASPATLEEMLPGAVAAKVAEWLRLSPVPASSADKTGPSPTAPSAAPSPSPAGPPPSLAESAPPNPSITPAGLTRLIAALSTYPVHESDCARFLGALAARHGVADAVKSIRPVADVAAYDEGVVAHAKMLKVRRPTTLDDSNFRRMNRALEGATQPAAPRKLKPELPPITSLVRRTPGVGRGSTYDLTIEGVAITGVAPTQLLSYGQICGRFAGEGLLLPDLGRGANSIWREALDKARKSAVYTVEQVAPDESVAEAVEDEIIRYLGDAPCVEAVEDLTEPAAICLPLGADTLLVRSAELVRTVLATLADDGISRADVVQAARRLGMTSNAAVRPRLADGSQPRLWAMPARLAGVGVAAPRAPAASLAPPLPSTAPGPVPPPSCAP